MQEQIKKTNATKTEEQKQLRIDRMRKTRIARNNGKWHARDFPEKCKKTLLKNHGDPNWHNVEATKKTLLQRYGVSCSLNIPAVEEKSAIAIKTRSYREFILNCKYDFPNFSEEFYCQNYDPHFLFEFKCKKCGNLFYSAHNAGMHKKCPLCYPKIDGTSKEEQELLQFVKSIHDGQIYTNTRTVISPLELDLYMPSKNLAIEFDGLYWHSDEQQKDNLYHLKKSKACESIGIQLIHVFEDEWIYKRQQVESKLMNIIGSSKYTFFASRCQTKEISEDDAKRFLEANDVFDGIVGNLNIGLFHNEMLIALMSVQLDCDRRLEVVRFCQKNYCNVKGCFQKIEQFIVEKYDPKQLVLRVDRRWSSCQDLKDLGFTLVDVEEPISWRVVGDRSRMSEMQHKEICIVETIDEDFKNAPKIFDCGNYIFMKEFKDAPK